MTKDELKKLAKKEAADLIEQELKSDTPFNELSAYKQTQLIAAAIERVAIAFAKDK